MDGHWPIVNRDGTSEAETSQIVVKYGLSFTGLIHWHAWEGIQTRQTVFQSLTTVSTYWWCAVFYNTRENFICHHEHGVSASITRIAYEACIIWTQMTICIGEMNYLYFGSCMKSFGIENCIIVIRLYTRLEKNYKVCATGLYLFYHK